MVTLTSDLKIIGVFYWVWTIFLPSRMTVTHNFFKILSGHGFCIKMLLWPWHLTSKFIGVIYWPRPICLPSRMTVTHKPFKILSRYGFCIKCFCDLDLWPSYLTTSRGHLLTMTNLPTKYYDCHSETSRYWADMMWLTDGRTPYHMKMNIEQ